MTPETNADLGPGWVVTQAPEGGVSLQVSRRGRGWVVMAGAAPALAWIAGVVSAVVAARPLPFRATPPMAIASGVLLTVLASWLAFGKEGWRVAPNCLEHRVGLGTWHHVRRYHDSTLEIVTRQDNYGKPYSRLYVVAGGRRRFLLERSLTELAAWGDLVAMKTGWPLKK